MSETAPSVSQPKDKAREGPQREKINWWHELRGLALMLVGVLAFHSFIASLLVGDRLVVSKYP